MLPWMVKSSEMFYKELKLLRRTAVLKYRIKAGGLRRLFLLKFGEC